jgi:hypothetical protein
MATDGFAKSNLPGEMEMTTTNNEAVVVGVFEARVQAERAIAELHAAGFTGDEIGFVMREVSAADAPAAAPVADGAASGIVAGGIAGGIWGALTALLIPGFGPAIAGGILTGILIGGAAGGLLGALMGMGVPEEEARYYQGEFEAGRALVTVRAGLRREEALAVLQRNGAYDMATRKNV